MTDWLAVKLLGGISVITKALASFFSTLWHLLLQLHLLSLRLKSSVSAEIFISSVIYVHYRNDGALYSMCLWCLCSRNNITDHLPLFRLEHCTVVRATNKATICIQTTARTCSCRGRQKDWDSAGSLLASSSLILFAVEQIILATCCCLAFWQCLPMKRLLIWTTLSCHLARWREMGIKQIISKDQSQSVAVFLRQLPI